jgi:hypothetical protein
VVQARRCAPILLAALAAALAACPERAREDVQPVSRDPSVQPAAAAGLRLSLPEGWAAHPEGEALVYGPAGRAVARLERVEVQDLPTTQELQEFFSRQVPSLDLRQLQAQRGEGFARWMGRVEAEAVPAWIVGLCARRAAGAIYLGGTLPGATEAEVRAALDVCVSLTTTSIEPPPPRPRRSPRAAPAR